MSSRLWVALVLTQIPHIDLNMVLLVNFRDYSVQLVAEHLKASRNYIMSRTRNIV